jgi:hypothetical protein
MYLLVNVLEQIESLPAILEEFAEIGIKGSTVINSTGNEGHSFKNGPF